MYVSGIGFPLVLLYFQKKSYSCNWYLQNIQQATDSKALLLPSVVLIEFMWNARVWLNHNIDSWWMNHWCLNHILNCFWWTNRCVNLCIFNWQITIRMRIWERRKLPHPSLFSGLFLFLFHRKLNIFSSLLLFYIHYYWLSLCLVVITITLPYDLIYL